MPQLELDERWFEIVATSPTAVLSRHRTSGSFTVWKLEWRDRADLPASFEAKAWEIYLKAQQQ